ncbi:MAG: hypothetical protein ACYTBV_08585, partial [Planctomycetota bacterium]
FTDEKVMETFRICEQNGVNTAILRLDDHCIGILTKYWKQRAAKMQWIAQVKIRGDDVLSDAKRAIDNGAVGGRFDQIGKLIEFAKKNKVIAGIGGHSLQVPKECEAVGLNPDFYMKTLHDHSYWSCTPDEVPGPYDLPRHDNMWATTPTETIEFMKTMTRPWIAFKVLAAGAVHPTKGFKFAFQGGADFACVGMFDFQVKDDVHIAKDIITNVKRKRPWRG